MAEEFVEVDPAELRLPGSRIGGPDPYKLQLQIARFGASVKGMPHLTVNLAADGVYEVIDGVTRATRIARLAPGQRLVAVIAERLKGSRKHLRRVGDLK